MDGVTEGRIVHYVLPDGESVGEHRPAIIVKVWGQSENDATVNLSVFTDHQNDYRKTVEGQHEKFSSLFNGANGLMWATSVTYSEEKRPHSWHWIEPA